MMQLKHELKEFVEHGQHILQKMEGSMGQRGFYGMRGGSGYGGGNYSSGGSYGNREWPQMPMQGGYPQQNYSPQEMMQGMNPLYFM